MGCIFSICSKNSLESAEIGIDYLAFLPFKTGITKEEETAVARWAVCKRLVTDIENDAPRYAALELPKAADSFDSKSGQEGVSGWRSLFRAAGVGLTDKDKAGKASVLQGFAAAARYGVGEGHCA